MSATEQQPEKAWTGKSRGGALGYRIFIWVLRRLGLGAAYTLLVFVAFYFLLFSFKTTRLTYRFLRQRLKKGRLAAVGGVYRTYFSLGHALIDRMAFMSGLGHRYTFEFDGVWNLEALRDGNQGALLIGGHLGNWDIAGEYLHSQGISDANRTHVVMLDAEHQRIKQLLEQIDSRVRLSVIPIKEDMSHIFQISQAIANRDMICIHGDRFVPGSKTITAEFMGEPAHFPLGVFQIASRMRIPCTFVFAMKEGLRHYHFYSTPPKVYKGKPEEAAQDFARQLEKMLLRYPYQWYNFYDFWAEPQPVPSPAQPHAPHKS